MRTDAAWYFAPNVTPAEDRVQFGAVSALASVPTARSTHFFDLAGDGTLDAVSFDGPVPGFSEYRSDLSWSDWRRFDIVPQIDMDSDAARLIDLTGDGKPDLMITTEDGRTVWYPSLGERGFGMGRRTEQVADDERGPLPLFSDDAAGLHVADMSGDGLADLVRIQNSQVCYWPNLGYGRFGAKVTMGGAPWFEEPDQFEQRRVQFADIDGSGTTDIVYLGRDAIRFWINQSGNR